MLAEGIILYALHLYALWTILYHSSMFQDFHFFLFQWFFFNNMVVIFTHRSTLYVPALDLHNKPYLSPAVSIPISQLAPTTAEPNSCVIFLLIIDVVCAVLLVFRLQTVNTLSLCAPFQSCFVTCSWCCNMIFRKKSSEQLENTSSSLFAVCLLCHADSWSKRTAFFPPPPLNGGCSGQNVCYALCAEAIAALCLSKFPFGP